MFLLPSSYGAIPAVRPRTEAEKQVEKEEAEAEEKARSMEETLKHLAHQERPAAAEDSRRMVEGTGSLHTTDSSGIAAASRADTAAATAAAATTAGPATSAAAGSADQTATSGGGLVVEETALEVPAEYAMQAESDSEDNDDDY